MPSITTAQIRRSAHRAGYRVVKIRDTSRDYAQYGPYALVDVATNGIVASGLADLDEVSAELERRR